MKELSVQRLSTSTLWSGTMWTTWDTQCHRFAIISICSECVIILCKITLYLQLCMKNILADLSCFFLIQANIKPEPEESWYNKRSTQDYNAMRGEKSVYSTFVMCYLH